MPRRSHASSSRTLLGITGLINAGVLALGATAIIAAPSASSTGNGTSVTSAAPAAHGSEKQRLIKWSGITWYVYPNCDDCGPSQTPTTNADEAVYVDDRGYLHMKVTKIGGKWRGVELRALNRPTYGTYRWIVDTATADLDRWAVLSMFVYRPGARKQTSEVDVEDSRFPHLLPAPHNAQFVVQPYGVKGNLHSYQILPTYHPLLQQFTWMPGETYGGPGRVHYETRVGSVPRAPLLDEWDYTGYSVPSPQNMQLFVVLWMNQNKTPTTGLHSAVVRSLTVKPLGG
ncbi:MAG TPA: hypothetical protein VHA79_04795 [Mycobacteriales bacterium]|nr:hypothetical protein [Mycobacteriales bacterium]HVX68988.1 hypothetical protein [Mycobacteriales bacterium]